jgi:hypothetical protein
MGATWSGTRDVLVEDGLLAPGGLAIGPGFLDSLPILMAW